jgi:hypothetical protein
MTITVTSRSAGLLLAAALTLGWVSASLTQSPVPEQTSRGSAVTRQAPPAVVPHAERLRQRLAEPPQPSRGRNPFVFGSRTASTRDHQRHGDEVVAPAPPPMPVEPPLPVFKLSGIASTAQDGSTTLTAIIIDNGSMVFARAGDKLSNGYSVVKVDEMSVTLVDAGGITQTIRLP